MTTHLKTLGACTVANAGEIAGREFHIPAPPGARQGDLHWLITRLTLQVEGGTLRWAVDGDATKGTPIRDGESHVFEGADTISRLTFAFGGKREACARVLFEGDGTCDMSGLLESANRSRGMTANEFAGWVKQTKPAARLGGLQPRGPDEFVAQSCWRQTMPAPSLERREWHEHEPSAALKPAEPRPPERVVK